MSGRGLSDSFGASLPTLYLPRTLNGLLEGKVGIVTGASRGIGAASAAAFAEAGARVVIAARDEDALGRVVKMVKGSGNDALAVSTDVTDPTAVERLVTSTLERYGKLDFAFNNAGSGHRPTPLAELGVEDFDGTLEVNVRGTFLCMKYEIPAMLKSGGGSIVNMSSTAGMQGVNGIAGYVAGKHAVVGLTRAAAMDYAKQNVRVNAVAPGPIWTERLAGVMTQEQAAFAVPIGHIGSREEVATVVAWLCSDLASFVTGVVVPVDGGRMAGVSFSRPSVTPTVTAGISGQTSLKGREDR